MKPKRGIGTKRGTWQSRPLAHGQKIGTGRGFARSADECGEWEDVRSEWPLVMRGIAVEILPTGATLADVHLVYTCVNFC